MVFAGRGGVFCDEKKLPNLDVVVVALALVLVGGMVEVVESSMGSVGRLFSLLRSGLDSLVDMVLGDGERLGIVSGSIAGMPTGTVADVPVNHEAIPPLDLSATLITPSVSPVRVGINDSTTSCCRAGAARGEGGCLRSGLFDSEVRKGSSVVSDL
jgi:hypothetical protein